LQDLAQAYEAFRRDDKLPASYEVVYGHAWRPQQKPSTKFDMPDVAPINFVSKKDDGLER
jgi:malonyl-CoA O-methyltransferase